MKKKTFEKFVEEANLKHNGKYSYDKSTYVNTHTKMRIICPKHGEFWQTPHDHLLYGCNKCAIEYRNNLLRGNLDDFIKKARKIHGDKYDYSKSEYVNVDTPMTIICPKHGEFKQTPTAHLHSTGCPYCAKERKNSDKRDTLGSFIEKAKKVYGDKYDYSKVNYINSRTPATIICPKHGEFSIPPLNFLHSLIGCPICRKETKIEKKKKILLRKKQEKKEYKVKNEQDLNLRKENFIEKAKKVHGDKYDYSKVNYVNQSTKVCIICPEHGEFWQTPKAHLKNHGCPLCGRKKVASSFAFNTEKFIENARKVHGDKYDYSKVKYVNNSTKVCIICPEHGEFWQTPAMHYNEGQGCPLCGTLSSNGENEIYDFLKENLKGKTVIQREHNIIKPKEIDIFLPEYNIGIEYNGLRWHSEQFGKDKHYHLSKTKECYEKGIRLIQIFEDEWLFHKEIVKDKLLYILHCDSVEKAKIYARKCKIKEININDAKSFLNKNHIQGWIRSTIYLGLTYNDELVSVMTFLKEKNGYVLNRFASNINYNVAGAASKLISYFCKNYDYEYITTFADLRWVSIDNNLYEKIGFKFDKIEKPDYAYVSSSTSFRKRIHKFNCRKKILSQKYNLPLSMTENKMTKKIGLYKIWNCGLVKYILKKH